MRFKVLTVDDSRTVRFIVRKALASYECEVIEAANGAEGLAQAVASRPSLILLDVVMPLMDGLSMFEKLRQDTSLSSIPVVLLTAEADCEEVSALCRDGARGLIVKPFSEVDLLAAVSSILDLPRRAPAGAPGRHASRRAEAEVSPKSTFG